MKGALVRFFPKTKISSGPRSAHPPIHAGCGIRRGADLPSRVFRDTKISPSAATSRFGETKTLHSFIARESYTETGAMAVPVESVRDDPPIAETGETAEAHAPRVAEIESSPAISTTSFGINDLPPEILWQVLSKLPNTASTANALCGVCRGWRDAILSEESYLNNLKFGLDANQPFRGLGVVRGAVAHRRTWASKRRDEVTREEMFAAQLQIVNAVESEGTVLEKAKEQMRSRGYGVPGYMSARQKERVSPRVPLLLERSAAIGKNVSALECLGELREHQGDHAMAHKAWKKAAMHGSSLGQFKLGEIFYRGLGNHGVDGEEALFWLSKAVKNSGDPLSAADLSTAACIMGYLFQDGEGTQACNVTAVKWFRVASSNGNVEATKTLGWLYNTGQY